MVFKSYLHGIVTPPPVMAPHASVASASALTSQILSQSLYQSNPYSSTQTGAEMKAPCLHPSQTKMAYLLDTPERPNSPQRQIVVQDYNTSSIVFKISLGDLCAIMLDLDKSASSYSTKLTASLRTLGVLQGFLFHDAATLEVNGMVTCPQKQERFSHLIVQFSSRIVVLNLRQGPNSRALVTSVSQKNSQDNPTARHVAYQLLQSQITESSLKALPTTMAVFISSSLAVVGASDGTIRVINVETKKMLKSARGPSGKNDVVVNLIAANPYNLKQPADKQQQQVVRLVSVSKKGTAYLWEVVLEDGHFDDIRNPVCRMDGVFGVPLEDGNWEHSQIISFDAHRQLLIWFVPSGYNSTSNKPHVLVFDLKKALKKKKQTSVPKSEACIISFPTVDVPVTLTGGWMHPAFAPNVFLCALVSQSGDVSLQVVNLDTDCKPGEISEAIPWFATSLPNLIQKHVGTMAPPVMTCNLIMTHPRLDTTSLLVGSTAGLVRLGIKDNGTGPLHAYLGPSHGSDFAKSILKVNRSTVTCESLEIDTKNPHGCIATKHQQDVYRSPPAQDLPPEIQKRSVRRPPHLYPSPSGKYLSLYWPDERRYEILHIASSLRKSDVFTPAVASGANVLDIAWVGDDDTFALLHPPLEVRGGLSEEPAPIMSDVTSFAPPSSSAIKSLRKNFNKHLMGNKMDKTVASAVSAMTEAGADFKSDRFNPRVELKTLVGVNANAAELGSLAAATARGIGELTLRGGTRHPPTTLFGGPNLCVASKDKSGDGGSSYFYTLKQGIDEKTAQNFVSAGPTLPCPDYVQWDDEGILCAVVVQGLVAVYLSKDQLFVLLGNVQLGAPGERDVTVTGLKFVHGVLYCTTKTTVQCIFFGDHVEEGICHLDAYVLASANGSPLAPTSAIAPNAHPMTLNHPTILGYQSGSLLVSTVTGMYCISLDHPLLRIGSLIAAGQHARAIKWFAAIPETQHEALANFLDHRGAANLAASNLTGLSLETMVDLSLRHGLTSRLVELTKIYGAEGMRQVDLGRGVSVGILGPEEHDHSLIVCVGAYLLSQGHAELVQQMARDCSAMGDEGRKEAFVLAALLLAVNPGEARKIVQGSVGNKEERTEQEIVVTGDPVMITNDYPVAALVRDHIL